MAAGSPTRHPATGPAATPLSEALSQILAQESPAGGVTLNAMFERTQGRGIFLFVILLCLPFLIPVSLPGLSTLLGSVVAVLGCRLALGLPQRLPRRIGGRALPPSFLRVLGGSVRVLRFLERRLIRPRRVAWLDWPAARCVNGLTLAFVGLLLALPIPPIIPLTNTLPAYAILFLAIGMMEGDVWLAAAGHAASAATVFYFWAWADAIAGLLGRHYDLVRRWFEGGL
jgi:hypothetical protein